MGEIKIKCVLIIPVFNPDEKLVKNIEILKKQNNILLETLIIDSGSNHQYEKNCDKDIKVMKIPCQDFDHGGTRQWGISLYPNVDVYVFITQDAILSNVDAIAKLVNVFCDENVGAVYGRQIPHINANMFAKIAREINYKNKSYIYSFGDKDKYGIKTCFMSNSFAAYRKNAMEDVGGFPRDTILSEDMYVAAKMLVKGWKIGYVADACVYHSHNYTVWQEFKRYFDIGVFHSRERWIRNIFGEAEGEGKKYILLELKRVMTENPYAILEMFVRDVAKFLGYKLGTVEKHLPKKLKIKLAMNKGFFDRNY